VCDTALPSGGEVYDGVTDPARPGQ